MTPDDADRLREWVEQMTTEQSALLWRWALYAHLDKCEREMRARWAA